MTTMIWALVPAHDAHSVRRALRQRGFAFTTQKARGGLWHTAHWIFWLIVSAEAVADATQRASFAMHRHRVRYSIIPHTDGMRMLGCTRSP